MLSLVISTLAFFVASYFIKRWANDNDIPKWMTRSISIIVLAIALSYCVAWVVDKLAAFTGA
jgi:VIT1/CCC1 family predicted Fe2+/Mn2+ transporter